VTPIEGKLSDRPIIRALRIERRLFEFTAAAPTSLGGGLNSSL